MHKKNCRKFHYINEEGLSLLHTPQCIHRCILQEGRCLPNYLMDLSNQAMHYFRPPFQVFLEDLALFFFLFFIFLVVRLKKAFLFFRIWLAGEVMAN